MEQRRNILKGLVGGAALWAAGAPASARAPFQSTRIVVETRGGGPDLILIPGLASTSAVWSRTAARLADRRRLHLISVRGFGLRGSAGLDYFVGESVSVGANLSGDLLFLSRPAVDGVQSSAAAPAQVYAEDGSSIGGATALMAVIGLHF